MATISINLDMDETLFHLSYDKDWLVKLRAQNPAPYLNAPPMLPMQPLAHRLNTLKRKGFKLKIISWLAKESTPEYDAQVIAAKLASLKKHLPSVQWDEILIVPYGTPKEQFCETRFDVLFDDNASNRAAWPGRAYDERDILNDLEFIKRHADTDLLFADWFPV